MKTLGTDPCSTIQAFTKHWGPSLKLKGPQ